jgi:hypothetical protein
MPKIKCFWEERKHADEVQYSVTVKTDAKPDWTAVVYGIDKWKARTRAMHGYPHRLGGDLVEFEVKKI